jgi:hypothetical protein
VTVTATSGMKGRQKKDGNHSPHNNKLVQEPKGKQENKAQIQTPTKKKR